MKLLNIFLPVSLTPIAINICINGAAVTGCSIYANNTAQPVCLQCSVGNFVGYDTAGNVLCVPNANQVNYCTNYDPTTFVCTKFAGGIAVDGTTTPPSCPVLPENLILNCKAVNIRGNDIKCI